MFACWGASAARDVVAIRITMRSYTSTRVVEDLETEQRRDLITVAIVMKEKKLSQVLKDKQLWLLEDQKWKSEFQSTNDYT